MPADGNKVKSWLRWHVDFFMISVVTFFGLLFKGRICLSDNNIYYYILLTLGITIMVQMIEINVVRKFHKEKKYKIDISYIQTSKISENQSITIDIISNNTC